MSSFSERLVQFVFSPDGQFVMAGSQDGALFAWNVEKKQVEKDELTLF